MSSDQTKIQTLLFQSQDISQKSFNDLVKLVKNFIKTPENVQQIFDILNKNISEVKSLSNFKYFVRFFNFLRMQICNKVLKKYFTPENEQKFLTICLQYSAKYTSIHMDDSQKKVLQKINRIFTSFSTEILVERYLKEEKNLSQKSRNLLIYLIVNVRKNSEAIQKNLVDKLSADYLVDVKQQNPKGFKLTKSLANAFNETIYQESFLPLCQKLIRRSEINLKTFLGTLVCNIDYSQVAEEILFKNLRDIYNSKDNSRIAYAMATRISQRCYKPEIQEIILDKFSEMLSKTHQEEQKFEYLMIITNLAQSCAQKSDSVLQKILATIIEQSQCISTEIQYSRINAQLQKIFKQASNDFVISDLNIFSDNLSSARKNNFQGIILCQILSLYIKRGIKKEEQKEELGKIGQSITNDIYLPNLKDSKKLVTNSFIFVASLEVATLCQQFSENIEKDVISSLSKLLVIDIFVNTREFLETNPQQELSIYASALIRIMYTIVKQPETVQKLGKTAIRVLQNTIIYLLVNTKISSEDTQQLLSEPSAQVFELLSSGLFFYYYLVFPQEICHQQSLFHKTNQILELLLSQLEKLGEQIVDINFQNFNFLIFNSITSKPKYEKRYWKIVAPFKDQIKEKLESQENIYNAYLLNSKMFIQNNNKIIRQGAKGIVQMLLNLGQVSLLEPFKMFLIKKNHEEDREPLEQFIEQSKSQEKEYFTNYLEQEKEIFFAQKILGGPNILLSQEEQESAQETIDQQKQESAPQKSVIQKKPAKKTGKAPIKKKPASSVQPSQPSNLEKFMMLDEEELKIKQYKDHKAKMLNYYKWSMEFIILLGTSKYELSTNFFFSELLSGFMEICGDSALQPLFKQLAKQIFQQQKGGFAQNNEAVAEFVVKYCENQVPNDKHLEGFTKYQNWVLNQKDFSSQFPEYIINFLHQTQKYIITKNGFDVEMKKLAMDFYLQLDDSLYKSKIIEIFEPLNENLNILASQENTLEFLNKLMRIHPDVQTISILFRDILNNVDKAKILVLKALISNQQLKFVPTFDDIIKLRILMIDDNEVIKQLAEKTINHFPYELNAKKIESFDLETFALIHSRENSEKFTQLAKDILKKHPDYNKVFFKILVNSANNLYSNTEISEECLLYFPHFLIENIEFISGELLDSIFQTLVEKYTNQEKESVQSYSLQAGIDIIKFHGAKHSSHIISILEKFLKSKDDQHQLSTIIFLGVIAPYIKNKSQVEGVSQKIMTLFEKGSENMQKQLARNMPELLNFFENPKKTAVASLQDLTYHSNYDMKRGCSYLIAGLNKGLGVGSIEDLKIFEFIDQNTDLKKDKSIKISVLLLVQAYMETFGRVFEPYIIKLTEIVMLFFTDRLEEIRDLALSTIKLMMKTLTAYGVKVILPQMLKGLEEPQWQAKVNNIWSLGNMAYCSAKQLSQCLPQIVPKISQCLSDTHPQIREASNDSLQNIGSTIQNPEISQIVDILIQALSDPFEKNKQGLEVLLQTKFEHYIDAPSLALVIPILDYAQKQKRNPEARMDACQVIGSISSLIKDISDLIPYMEILVEGLHSALGDPDTGVRTFGAKAVGKLAQKLDGFHTEKYFTFVQESIENENTPSIERGGVASALAEMMCSLGPEYFDMKINEIFQKMKDPREHMKEGYIGVFVFLPTILKDKFKVHISKVLDNTVEYVTHQNDKVRDISLRVLKILIQNFGIDNTDLLMQPINEGMFSTNWRKRNSALILSGEMLEVLSKFCRISEGEEYTPEQLDKLEARNTNIMGIYILRSDEIDQIKNTATNVWKNFIDNTPKTLKSALGIFFDKLCASIMMHLDIQVITIKCLKEFSTKYGESFFPQIMEEVQHKLETKGDNLGYITGLCLVLREIMQEISPQILGRYKDSFIDLVKKYLFTQDKYLREAIFKFYRIIVEQCSNNDYILQQIINQNFNEFCALESETDPKYNTYIDIFNNILQQDSQKILSHVLPMLFTAPLKVQQVDIITNNAEIVGREIYQLINTSKGGFEIMLEEAFKCEDSNLSGSILYCLEQLSINIGVEDMKKLFNYLVYTLNILNNEIDQNLKQIDIILSILNFYFYNTTNRLNEYNNDFIQQLVPIIFLDSKYTPIIKKNNDILQSFFGSLDRKIHFSMMQQTSLIIRNNIDKFLNLKNLKPNEFKINGFNFGDEPGQGIAPYIDMIISCLVYNSDTEFDHALNLVDFIVTHSELENLNAHIMKIVGPLVRVINYKYEQERKERIVQILHRITEKKMNIQLFTTQLQSTYLKLLQEFPRDLEFLQKISQNMIDLLEFSNKKDLILHELNHRFKDETNQIVKEAYLYVMVKYIKTDIQQNKNYFAKALLEKLFENFQKISHKDDLNNNILFYLCKLIGHLSNYASPQKTLQYQQEILNTLKESSDTPHHIFFCLGNLLAMYNYNLQLHSTQVSEEWQSFKPLDNLQELMLKNIKHFSEKEWLHFIANTITKINKNPKTISGQLVSNTIKLSELKKSIDPQLLEFEDIKTLFK